jgi:hypothetical protein
MHPDQHRTVAAVLAVLGVAQLALAAYMTLAPRSFFDLIGPWAPYNPHYVRDVATYNAALGIVALGAVRRPSWSVLVLVFATAQYALHAVNHLADVGEADPRSTGVIDLVLLALVAVALGTGLRLAHRARHS